MENETTTAANWMSNFPDPTVEEEQKVHVRWLEERVAELSEILWKLRHGTQLTLTEQNSVCLTIEDSYQRVAEELFAARGGEIVP